MKKGFLFFLSVSLLLSCKNEGNEDALFLLKSPYGVVPQPSYNLASEAGIALGKKLFFDPVLSANNSISCASCHVPSLAFSDGVALSNKGVSTKPLSRNSPALFNLAWMQGVFWDGGAKNLESQVFGPLTHPDEMAMDLLELSVRLQKIPEYRKLFKDVWQTDSILSFHIARSIAQYERSLISFNTPFDLFYQGKKQVSEIEKPGYAVFMQKCESCHKLPLFTDNSYHNNGIDDAFMDTREELLRFGRYRITNDSADIGKYKTPSLRNIKFTAPYMHDGRFATLEAVLNHYSKGVHQNSPNLDSRLNYQGGFSLNEQEIRELLIFLNMLNDETFIKSH